MPSPAYSELTTDYATNVEGFRHFAKITGAQVTNHTLTGYTGPKGEELTTHVATLGDNQSKNVVVISSGAHGAELPFGSAVQKSWLIRAMVTCLQSSNTRFVFVHALNPFGAAHMLRNDQANIDVCRNFVDHDAALPVSLGYRELAGAFAPANLGAAAFVQTWGKMLRYAFVDHSIPEFKQVLAGGQYEFPGGVYYGGSASSWSRRTWETILERNVFSPSAQHIVHLDLHTGDGAFGAMKVLINSSQDRYLMGRVLQMAPQDTVSEVSSSIATLSGDITDAWPRYTPRGVTVTPMTLEFGTSRAPAAIEGIDLLKAMIERNALFVRHGDKHPKRDKVIATMREAFTPSSPAWEQKARNNAQLFWQNFFPHLRKLTPG